MNPSTTTTTLKLSSSSSSVTPSGSNQSTYPKSKLKLGKPNAPKLYLLTYYRSTQVSPLNSPVCLSPTHDTTYYNGSLLILILTIRNFN